MRALLHVLGLATSSARRLRSPAARLLLVAATAFGCATTTPKKPPPLAELLAECTADAEEPAPQFQCNDLVTFSVGPLPYSDRARTRAEALAHKLGASLSWGADEREAQTVISRGTAMSTSGVPLASVIIARDLRPASSLTFACTAQTAAGDERCRALVASALAEPPPGELAAAPGGPAAWAAWASGSIAHEPAPFLFFGRPLALPDDCVHITVEGRGPDAMIARCHAGGLDWSPAPGGYDAVRAPGAGEVEVACTVAGYAARCLVGPHAILTVVDLGIGTGAIVECHATTDGDPRENPICRAAFSFPSP